MKRHQKISIFCIGIFSALCILFTATYASAATQTITAKVNCERPKAGTYSLGWGTSRLILPESGTPYSTFRGKEKLMTDGNLCQAGDNAGAIFLRNDRTVWAYTRATD
jgi:hypothetical protein